MAGERTDGTGGTAVGGGWVRPCSYTSITSPFGNRVSPTTGASTYHQGVDLDTGTGWPVVAAKAGRVVVAGYGSAAGNYVKIDHGDGVSSIYMHLSNYCVSAGQMVSAGQQIGTTGATGVATGDHLHFGIAVNGTIEKGRDLSRAGAHCAGHNANSIGVCYIGGRSARGVSPVTYYDTRTEAQKK